MRRFPVVVAIALFALSPKASHAQIQVLIPGIRVTVAPPPLRYEVAPAAPSPRHQWIAGYWAWRGNTHAWIAGHWALPPAPSYVWEPARWENVNGAWIFSDGHWRPTDAPDPTQAYQPPAPPVNEVVTGTQPPPPIMEVQPAQPFATAVWIPGYWHWNGVRYAWVVGRWSPRPAGHEWEAHRWDRREDGRWVERAGHWHPQAKGHERGER